jgi:PAP2 superfamily
MGDLRPAEAALVDGTAAPSLRDPLERIEWVLDHSSISRSRRAKAARIGIGVLFLVFGLLALVIGARHDDLTLMPLLFIVGSIPIFMNRFGRFGRFFLPVILGMMAYAAVTSWVTRFKLGVHVTPQIWAERHLTPGSRIPTVWLQEHLYHGRTGWLEVFSVAAYISHFVVPLLVAAALAIAGRSRDFKILMFGILTVSVLGSITFLVAPTAPPWLASQDGSIGGVHHILKQSLFDLHMTSLAGVEGDAGKYDVTAAVPSLHAAFPLIVLLTVVNARLPRWVAGLVAFQLVAVIFAIVYLGEHYVFDALVGLVFAAVAWLAVRWVLADEPAEEPAASRQPAPPVPAHQIQP